MRLQKILCVFSAVMSLGIALVGIPAHAQGCDNPNDILGIDCGAGAGLTQEDPRVLTVRIINFSLTFLGIVAFVIVLYAGFTWMTAGGNDEKVGSAKKILISAVAGLVIIMVSYSITSFILRSLCQTTGSCGTTFGIFN